MTLVVDGLTVSYGGAEVLTAASFCVEPGEFVAVLGPNGAGKTTLLRTISGLLRPSRGSISFDGRRIDGARPDRIVAAGVVHCPEGRRAFPEHSVEENLILGATRSRAQAGARIAEVYDRLPRLRERRSQPAGLMSGGEQQMLAIGRAMMAAPKLLMLDEPSLGLAPSIADDVFDLLTEIRAGGVSVLLVEQEVDRALEVSDRACVLERGRVVVTGDSDEVRGLPELQEIYLGVKGGSGASHQAVV